MSLYKRGGVYHSYVWQDGVRYQKSTGTANRQKAQLIDQRFKVELNLQRHQIRQPTPHMTFGEVAARFLAEGTPRAYHVDRLKLLLPFFSECAVGSVHKGMVREYRARRHAAKQVSDTTINRDIEALRHILYWAVEEGFLPSNPLSHVPMERERRKPRPVLSVAEENPLLAAAAPHLKPIIIAALDTGMRRGEILHERWEHVDLGRQLLFVTRAKTAEGEAREIPLTGRMIELLGDLPKSDDLVFLFRNRPLHRIKTAWKAALRRSAIRPLRFHDLRHTFNTRLMEAGVLADIRKALMGHSSGEDVHAIYTHVELPAKREAIRKLETWLEAQRRESAERKNADEQSAITKTSDPGTVVSER
jgi:integrase